MTTPSSKKEFLIEMATWHPVPLSALSDAVEAMSGANRTATQAGLRLDERPSKTKESAAYEEYFVYQTQRGREPYRGPSYTMAIGPSDIVLWFHLALPPLADAVVAALILEGMKKGLAGVWQWCGRAGRRPDVCITMSFGKQRAHYHLPEDSRAKTKAINSMAQDFGSFAVGHRVWDNGHWTPQ